MVLIIFSGVLSGVLRFLFILFTALVGVPLCWVMFRGEKAGDQEHTYDDPSVKPTPTEKFGEFKIEGPGAEAGVYGPTRSSNRFFTGLMVNREWLHPDNVWYKEHLKKKQEKAEEKTRS